MTKLTQICFLGAAILVAACNKKTEQPAPTCFDGIMNGGELGVDCGGPCAPCPTFSTPIFFAAFNGDFINFPNFTAQYGDTIYLNAYTDSVQVNLIFKNLTTPDEDNLLYPLVPNLAPYVTYNSVNYNNANPAYSVVVLTKNENNKISGLFQLALPHGFNNMDTLRVINGTFENIPY
jgi:hypothetical protein